MQQQHKENGQRTPLRGDSLAIKTSGDTRERVQPLEASTEGLSPSISTISCSIYAKLVQL
jgi:hypothetical protein